MLSWRASCAARNTSVGADGIEFLERRANGEFFLRLFNADGSEAELSGNGTRCVAAWLASSEGLRDVALGTHGGVRTCRVVEAKDPVYLIESEMGIPRVMPRTIELPGVGNVAGAMVNVGNPHFVLFVEADDFSTHGLSWQEAWGADQCESAVSAWNECGVCAGDVAYGDCVSDL